MTRVIKCMTYGIFIYVFPREYDNRWKIVATVRSGRESSFTRDKSPHGKNYRGKAWNERRTGCRYSRLIPIRSQQIRHKGQREHIGNRKRSRSTSTCRQDDNLSYARTRPKDGIFEALLPSLQSNPRKRVTVPTLSE